MRVSQRLDYSLRLLIALAQLETGVLVSAGELAERLALPRRFLELQATALAKHDLVECRRGTGGGCCLARPAETITVADVVRAVEGTLLDAPLAPGLASTETWKAAGVVLGEYLGSVTLADLAVRQRALDADRVPMYFI
ncbi:MAG: transcriptional regulator [Actinobacteria bacterium HGW-Actinobacteria-1]|jgi:Rrf2 family protein|nr:MAG: transcriptional regulator [Actinobacteria bacterium HGW-Actinobacteria-1]